MLFEIAHNRKRKVEIMLEKFEGEVSNIHNANECINVEKFFQHAQICLESMYNLYTKG